MCLITFGKLPSQESLENADLSNPDGIGAAWLTKRGVWYEKGLSVKDLLKLPGAVKESVALHFRLATVGGNTPSLIHPFPVTERVPLSMSGFAPAVIFHNGHIGDWEKIKRATTGRKLEGPVSDSRVLARFVYNYGHKILNVLYGQRVLYLSRTRSVLYGQGWNEESGTWYSNNSHKSCAPSRWTGRDGKTYLWDDKTYEWKEPKTKDARRHYAGMTEKEIEEFWREVKQELEADERLTKN